MTAKVLVVDDEPDLEALITQKFRRQIRVRLLHGRQQIKATHARHVDVREDQNQGLLDGTCDPRQGIRC